MPVDKSVLDAFANVAASQVDVLLVAAVPDTKICVLAVAIVGGDTNGSTVTFNSKPGGAGSPISATFDLPANGQLVLPESGGWFETGRGEGLSVTTGAGAATPVAVQVIYALIRA